MSLVSNGKRARELSEKIILDGVDGHMACVDHLEDCSLANEIEKAINTACRDWKQRESSLLEKISLRDAEIAILRQEKVELLAEVERLKSLSEVQATSEILAENRELEAKVEKLKKEREAHREAEKCVNVDQK